MMIPDKLLDLRDENVKFANLGSCLGVRRGSSGLTYSGGFNDACVALLPVMREMIEALEDCDERFQGTHEMTSVALANAKEVLGE